MNKPELLKKGKLNSLYGGVREAAVPDVGKAEGGREAEDRSRYRVPLPAGELELLEVVESGGRETSFDGMFVVWGVQPASAKPAAGALVGGNDA
jgi:hypothetical protein